MSKKIGIRPLRDKVVIERDETETTTAGGLSIPEGAKEKPVRGTVMAAGPGLKDDPMMVNEGDAVLFSKHSGIEVDIDGKKYLVMREIDILAVVN